MKKVAVVLNGFNGKLVLLVFIVVTFAWRFRVHSDLFKEEGEIEVNQAEAELQLTSGASAVIALGEDRFTNNQLDALLQQKISWEDTVDEKWKLTEDSKGKFFVYQPSGGWGNQRMILKNAIAAANGMDRILVLPKIAPHNFLWYGYERFNSNETVSMGELLDIDLLNTTAKRGVKVYNGTLTELRRMWRHKKWKVYTKSRYVLDSNGKPTKERLFYSDTYMRKHWRPKTQYDVIFFNKGGMWLCCGPSNHFSQSIGFNKHVKAVAVKLIHLGIEEGYNAVHIRRGGGHTSHDRKTAANYYNTHLKRFDKEKPLYIATDEKDKSWFDPFKTEYGFKKLIFWSDLDSQVIARFLANFPKTMHGDLSGFIDQLICAKAAKWAGSHASTFSAAIGVFRSYKELRVLRLDKS